MTGSGLRLSLLEIRRVGDDHVLVDAQRDVAVDLDQKRRLLHLLDRAVDAAGGDDLVALFQPIFTVTIWSIDLQTVSNLSLISSFLNRTVSIPHARSSLFRSSSYSTPACV